MCVYVLTCVCESDGVRGEGLEGVVVGRGERQPWDRTWRFEEEEGKRGGGWEFSIVKFF